MSKLTHELVPTIGIECHVQLKTATKLFAAVSNDARNQPPNSVVTPICFGFPGTLPVLNEAALALAIRAGHALSAEIATFSVFDRKHYFYPDLPKGYQISQYHQPIVGKGKVEVPDGNGGYKTVGITRAHLEEDAGKLVHEGSQDYSLVDLNRAGTPLLEVVSEPQLHSAQEARAYASELYLLMTYAGVTNGDLYEGNMRFDVNVSLAPKGSKQLGIRTEIKNLNSFKSVERAAELEIARQKKVLTGGGKIEQQTLGWDEAKGTLTAQRSKEEAHDYRYFPDPDLPPIELTPEEIAAELEHLPMLPQERRQRFKDLSLDDSQITALLNRPQLGELLLDVMESVDQKQAKRAANLLSDVVAARFARTTGLVDDFKLTCQDLITVVEMLSAGELNSNAADKLVTHLIDTNEDPRAVAKRDGLTQVNDESALRAAVKDVLEANSSAVADYRAGKQQTLGFLIGQTMASLGGSANPSVVKEQILKQLDNS